MFDQFVRTIYRRLWPEARNSLRTWLVLEAQDQVPQPIEQYDERRVMVLAPHSDDEVIGCGGVIARHVQAGATLHCVVMTDGRWGDASLFAAQMSDAERARRQTALVEARQRESRAAADVLGVREVHFLDRPDGGLRADEATVAALARILETFAPELVYLPFVYDRHEDHWQTNLVFAEAAQRHVDRTMHAMRVRGYEVWTPLPANRVADITELMPLKREALAKFASQLRDQDYQRVAEGINAYRSGGTFGGRGFAEAFHEASLPGYLRLVRTATLRDGPSWATAASPRPVREAVQ